MTTSDEPSIADQLQSLHQALQLDTRSYNYSYHRKSDPSFQYLLSAQKLIDTFDLGDYNMAMKECSRCRILFNKAEKRLDDANAKRVGSISQLSLITKDLNIIANASKEESARLINEDILKAAVEAFSMANAEKETALMMHRKAEKTYLSLLKRMQEKIATIDKYKADFQRKICEVDQMLNKAKALRDAEECLWTAESEHNDIPVDYSYEYRDEYASDYEKFHDSASFVSFEEEGTNADEGGGEEEDYECYNGDIIEFNNKASTVDMLILVADKYTEVKLCQNDFSLKHDTTAVNNLSRQETFSSDDNEDGNATVDDAKYIENEKENARVSKKNGIRISESSKSDGDEENFKCNGRDDFEVSYKEYNLSRQETFSSDDNEDGNATVDDAKYFENEKENARVSNKDGIRISESSKSDEDEEDYECNSRDEIDIKCKESFKSEIEAVETLIAVSDTDNIEEKLRQIDFWLKHDTKAVANSSIVETLSSDNKEGDNMIVEDAKYIENEKENVYEANKDGIRIFESSKSEGGNEKYQYHNEDEFEVSYNEWKKIELEAVETFTVVSDKDIEENLRQIDLSLKQDTNTVVKSCNQKTLSSDDEEGNLRQSDLSLKQDTTLVVKSIIEETLISDNKEYGDVIVDDDKYIENIRKANRDVIKISESSQNPTPAIVGLYLSPIRTQNKQNCILEDVFTPDRPLDGEKQAPISLSVSPSISSPGQFKKRREKLDWRSPEENCFESLSDWLIRIKTIDNLNAAAIKNECEYRVHKIIFTCGLRSSGQIFKDIVKENHHSYSIELIDSAADAFPVVLDYMYNNDSAVLESLDSKSSVALRHLSKLYDLPDLRKIVTTFIKKDFCFETALDYLVEANKFGEKKLAKASADVCAANMNHIHGIQNISVNLLLEIVNSSKFYADSEQLSLMIAQSFRQHDFIKRENVDIVQTLTSFEKMPSIHHDEASFFLQVCLELGLSKDTDNAASPSLYQRCITSASSHWREVVLMTLNTKDAKEKQRIWFGDLPESIQLDIMKASLLYINSTSWDD